MLFFTLLITSLAALDIPDFVFNRPFGKVESTTPFPVNVGNLREATRAVRLPGGDIRLFDAEDAEDGIKWGVTIGNKDELENGGINWGEITKIAGQIHDIGKVLGFAAEDLEDKTHWSVTIGNADEVENGGVNWSEITKIAGQINEIGHILGYDTKEDDILSLPKFGRGLTMPRSLLPHGRRTKSTKGNRLGKAHNHSTKASDLTNGYHTRCPACFAAEDANNWTVKPYSPAKPLFPRPKPAIW